MDDNYYDLNMNNDNENNDGNNSDDILNTSFYGDYTIPLLYNNFNNSQSNTSRLGFNIIEKIKENIIKDTKMLP